MSISLLKKIVGRRHKARVLGCAIRLLEKSWQGIFNQDSFKRTSSEFRKREHGNTYSYVYHIQKKGNANHLSA